ncbi:MAG: DUF1116 domain-containing protein [Candidatus Rokubacteria bacterium]|nr:DUF1116 domain-containing protein [Candidatus Rokubacteria bacterium]
MVAPLTTAPRVVSLGVETFSLELARLGVAVEHVAWRPPAGGDERLAALLARLDARRGDIDAANKEALGRMVEGQPVLVDCRPAREALALPDRTVLHAGPPIAWQGMCAPLRAAVLCAVRYEGWAANDDAAAALVEGGGIALAPCHHWQAAGPMTGIITRSMPVFVVENRAWGNRAHATINEGLGRVLRFGANDESVVARLRWLATEAGPLLGAALRASGGLDLRALMAQALRMGDEMHQRNVAASSLLARALMPHVARAGDRHHAVARLAEFIAGNDQFFLNVAMAAGKALADPAGGVAGSTLVTAMARNGTDFGIRVSGLGERWLTAPVSTPVGLYFPGFTAADANPDMGDSAIVETIGLGGAAMAASPAVARFVGAGGLGEALAATEEIAEISLGAHPYFHIPTLDDRGAPVGIDVRLVVETGIAPLINTGIAGHAPGTGQVGAGVVRAPLACFELALEALALGLTDGEGRV